MGFPHKQEGELRRTRAGEVKFYDFTKKKKKKNKVTLKQADADL